MRETAAFTLSLLSPLPSLLAVGGRRAAGLDAAAQQLTLDDGRTVAYDDLLIATGSSAVRPPIAGADGPGIHSFWTFDQAEGVG